MSRLSFRPRPLDIHKKLPIVKSVKEFEDDEVPTSTRNSQMLRIASEADNEVRYLLRGQYKIYFKLIISMFLSFLIIHMVFEV